MPAFNTVYSVFSGIGFILAIVPLSWHLESWNVGTCMYMIWTALACLVHFVDSILWNGNAINWAPVWCDIAIRIQIAVAVAWPACGLCIIRRLYYIASPTTVTTSQADKRREMIVDLLITIGIPVLEMCLEYIVAGHRFNIYEDYGCAPATWNTPLAYVLVHSWPLIIALISATYGALTIRAFMKRRKQFRDLITANSNLTYSRYWRLVALASLDFCFTIPFATWGVVGPALWSEVRPWVSWADTHWGYSRVFQFPRILLDPVSAYSLETTRWAAVFCAFVFFGFFGFADEARKNYRLLASTVTKRLGYTTFSESMAISDSMVKSNNGSKSGVSLPVFITQQIESKRDSFDSYSDKLSTSIILNDCDLKVQPYSPTEQSTSSSSSSMISPVDEVPRVPESVLDHTSVRRPSVPDAPKSVYPDSALDQV
ncbi:STE3-domain-containing protein [Thelephora terrestris]|uniref:STE3-domain-containing protein n=1 Tax=Thelephora terrestris TaxID=56493 RepID=A0A9P6HPD5_9AGAM|nr:STE3-domain-containing protein [Thelephora terrestris]